ncbi:MAG TPA: DUF2334 domain-containing protein [Haliangiales bacterium]|nr:DUF2334 domain-containing protein [Haliangiales bacterium]
MPLLCALHDVAPPHLPAIRALRDRLRARGVAAATLLVVPRYHGEALERSPETVAWLRAQAAAGDEICLHGFHHRETAPLVGWLDRARAALFTAGEGECLATPAFAPLLRAGRALVEDLVGTAVRGFVAPAWLEPRGFGRLLAAEGFGWHETRWGIERLSPRRRHLAPVLSFAARTRARRRTSLAAARLLRPLVAAAGTVRLALHPGDLAHPELVAFAEETAAGRRAVTCSRWLDEEGAGA